MLIIMWCSVLGVMDRWVDKLVGDRWVDELMMNEHEVQASRSFVNCYHWNINYRKRFNNVINITIAAIKM